MSHLHPVHQTVTIRTHRRDVAPAASPIAPGESDGRARSRRGLARGLAAAMAVLAALVIPMGAAPATAAAGDAVIGWFEIEDGTLSGGASGLGSHSNFSGSGFITLRDTDRASAFTVEAPEAGTYPVYIRYANGALSPAESGSRTISLMVNGAAQQLSLPPSEPYDWESWEVFTTSATLQAGANTMAVRCNPAVDFCRLNFDAVQIGGASFDAGCPAAAPEPGYTSLFDGTFTSFDRWRHAGAGTGGGAGFGRQADCTIRSYGGAGAEWFLDAQTAPYTLRLDFRAAGADDDSGVFVGAPGTNAGSAGYEVDISPTSTGSIVGRQPADAAAVAAALNPPGEWNALQLEVDGALLRVRLNGHLVNVFAAPAALSGHVGLQFAGTGNDVSFRDIRVKAGVAPDPVPTTVTATVAAGPERDAAMVTATVRAADGAPAGAVTVSEGGDVLGSGTLDAAGVARVALTGLAVGTHSLDVAYAGSGRHLASSASVSLVVATPDPDPDPDPEPEPEPAGAVYTPIAASRLLDTRPGGATIDGRFAGGGRMGAGSVATLRVAGRAGIPGDAGAAVLNVTATDPGGEGYLTVWPCDAAQPTASSVNFAASTTVANTVVAGLDRGGYVCIFASAAAHVIVDAGGHLPGGNGYTPVVPTRLLDTRQLGRPAHGYALRVPVAGRGGVPAGGAAAALNLTVTDASGPGYLTVWPCGGEPPVTSSLNYVAGQTVANAVVSGLGAAGEVCVYVGGSTAHVVVDVDGWFAADTGLTVVEPRRLLDSRRSGTAAAGYTVKVPVAGQGGIPAAAGSAVLNVTAVDPTGDGYLTVHPCGTAVPNASNVNFTVGRNAANLVVAPLDPSGVACIHVAGSATSLLVDVNAWLPATP